MFSNMYGAYEDLSPDFKRFLDGLTAKHESKHFYRGRYAERGVDDTNKTYPQANHPVVRTHPQTGREALFINRTFTGKINKLSESEGGCLLNFLWERGGSTKYQKGSRWSVHNMASWDNRCCMHRAIWGY